MQGVQRRVPPPGSRTLRREKLHVSPHHADHDTEDGDQSESQASVHQHGGDQGGEEARVDMERGPPTAVTWRADVTVVYFQPFRRRSSLVKCVPQLKIAKNY